MTHELLTQDLKNTNVSKEPLYGCNKRPIKEQKEANNYLAYLSRAIHWSASGRALEDFGPERL
jgi:hypothetical protein